MRNVTPRGSRHFQLVEGNVAHCKFSTRKVTDSRRHFGKRREVESPILSDGFRKELLDVKELRQSSEINKVPWFCATKYCQYLVNREFPARKDQGMSALIRREKPTTLPPLIKGGVRYVSIDVSQSSFRWSPTRKV